VAADAMSSTCGIFLGCLYSWLVLLILVMVTPQEACNIWNFVKSVKTDLAATQWNHFQKTPFSCATNHKFKFKINLIINLILTCWFFCVII
jgi:hypothetical protein